jgi:hypothetical protein
MAAVPMNIYCGQMDHVRLRMAMLDRYVEMAKQAPEELELTVAVEAAALELRLTLEHVAFASLSANKDAYAKARKEYEKHFHAKFILNGVEEVNPKFYPWPVQFERNGNHVHISPLQAGYLTRKEFEKAYDKCGSLLHARNPFRPPINYRMTLASISEWATQLRTLLDEHIVEVVGLKGFVLVSMQGPNGKARAQVLEPIDGGDFIRL